MRMRERHITDIPLETATIFFTEYTGNNGKLHGLWLSGWERVKEDMRLCEDSQDFDR